MKIQFEFHKLQSFMSPPMCDHWKIRITDDSSGWVDVVEMCDIKMSEHGMALSEKACNSLLAGIRRFNEARIEVLKQGAEIAKRNTAGVVLQDTGKEQARDT